MHRSCWISVVIFPGEFRGLSPSRLVHACHIGREGLAAGAGWMGEGAMPGCGAGLIVAASGQKPLLLGPKDRGSVALRYLEVQLASSFAPEKGCRRSWWLRCSGLPSCRCCCCKCSPETKLLVFNLLLRDTVTAVRVCTLQKMMQRINPPAVTRGIKTDLNINTHFYLYSAPVA